MFALLCVTDTGLANSTLIGLMIQGVRDTGASRTFGASCPVVT